MDKIDIVLVVPNRELLESTIKNLNLDNVNLLAIMTDNNGGKIFQLGEAEIPLGTFQGVKGFIQNYKSCLFLIGDCENNIDDVSRMKNFLIFNGLAEENIVNFKISAQISQTWLANLKHIEKHSADFFATGNEYTRNGLNLDYIPRVYDKESKNRGGVILADEYQDLRQSYLTAKYVFEHTKPGTIKFVLIGLSPDSFQYDNTKDFSNCSKNLQYALALNLPEENLLKDLISNDVKNIFTETTSEQADLNFGAIKETLNHKFSIKVTVGWEDDSQSLTVTPNETNIQILKSYIELCFKNGAKPIGVVFPFAEIARKTYNKKLLKTFRDTIKQVEKEYVFACIDYFDHLGYDCFYDMTHLNLKGTWLTSSVIAMKLNAADIIPTENFLDMNCDYFFYLSLTASKIEYDELFKKIFESNLKRIRGKYDKIKIGFVACWAEEWCGDELYNLFATDERFDATIFLCFESDIIVRNNEFFKENFWQTVEQFKERGLNVVAVDNDEVDVPVQDVIIFLTPYFNLLPKAFSSENLTLKTLITNIPREFDLTLREKNYYKLVIFRILRKMFFSSKVELGIYDKGVQKGMPRGLYSGYPRTDIFFKDNTNFNFEWKMARPDAKKIIYAPHWSTNEDEQISTQWNYQFIYEFAKAHPEISWVVKPYKVLFLTGKDNGFFFDEEYERYLRQWDELPNAQIYMGAYYQEIFATSDGMIHDGGSLIAEYQYVNKPMIYLSRKGEKFNDIGKEMLKAVYLIDEKNLKGLVETIEKVFIEGKDDKAAQRKEVFDKYLNYPKATGMTASEFIYHNIADELKKE